MKYLQLNGTNDFIKAPAGLTFTKVVMEMKVKVKTGLQYFIHSTSLNAYLYKNPPVDNFGGFSTVTVDGTGFSNGVTGIPTNKRITLEANTTARTEELYFGKRASNIQYGMMDVYNIKIYNGTSLVAHYDMSTGTVNDQSGNGNHATYQGTFIDEAKTYSLSMDGTDDKLVIPAMTATEFVLEMKPRPNVFEQYIAFNTNMPVNRNGNNDADQFNAGYSAVYVDDVQVTTNTAFIKVNQRQVLRGISATTGTLSTYVFWNGNANYMAGELYSLKIYNAGALQAEYDFTKGHVLDISGNSRHATLTGGTWLEEGTAQLVTTGLTGYWNAKEGYNGTTWNDLSGNNVTLNLVGTTAQSDGIYFDGVDDKAQSVDNALVSPQTDYTIEFGIKLREVAATSYILWGWDEVNLLHRGINVNSSEVLRLADPNSQASNYTIPKDLHVQIAFRKLTDTTHELYINGEYRTTVTTVNPFNGIVGGLYLANDGGSNYLPATYSYVRLYNRSLTTNELRQNYLVGTDLGIATTVIHLGESSLSSDGSLSVDSSLILTGDSSMSVDGSLIADASLIMNGASTLSAESTMDAIAMLLLTSSSSLSADSVLVASGDLITIGIRIDLSASGDLTGIGTLATTSTISLSADGSVSVSANLLQTGASTLSASGTLTAEGMSYNIAYVKIESYELDGKAFKVIHLQGTRELVNSLNGKQNLTIRLDGEM